MFNDIPFSNTAEDYLFMARVCQNRQKVCIIIGCWMSSQMVLCWSTRTPAICCTPSSRRRNAATRSWSLWVARDTSLYTTTKGSSVCSVSTAGCWDTWRITTTSRFVTSYIVYEEPWIRLDQSLDLTSLFLSLARKVLNEIVATRQWSWELFRTVTHVCSNWSQLWWWYSLCKQNLAIRYICKRLSTVTNIRERCISGLTSEVYGIVRKA